MVDQTQPPEIYSPKDLSVLSNLTLPTCYLFVICHVLLEISLVLHSIAQFEGLGQFNRSISKMRFLEYQKLQVPSTNQLNTFQPNVSMLHPLKTGFSDVFRGVQKKGIGLKQDNEVTDKPHIRLDKINIIKMNAMWIQVLHWKQNLRISAY